MHAICKTASERLETALGILRRGPHNVTGLRTVTDAIGAAMAALQGAASGDHVAESPLTGADGNSYCCDHARRAATAARSCFGLLERRLQGMLEPASCGICGAVPPCPDGKCPVHLGT